MLLLDSKRLLRAGALVVSASGLAASLVACGQEGTTGAGGTCSATAPGITPTEIRAGMVWNDTGPGASTVAPFRAGVDARLHVLNEQDGGIYGRKVTYAWRDDQSDPTLSLRMVQELLNQENVFGFIYSPGGGRDSAKLLEERAIPVTGIASDPIWLGMNNMFSWFYLGDGFNTTWGNYVQQQGGTRAAIFTIDASASSLGFAQQVAASLTAAGVKVVQTFPTGASTSYRVIARQLKENDIDTLAGVLLPSAAAQLLPELAQLGVSLGHGLKVALLPAGYDHDSLTEFGPSIAGASILSAIQPFELDSVGQQRFRQAMSDYVPEIQPPTQDMAVNGWLSADLFIRGLEAAGECPTRESFISGLRAVQDYDGAGLAPDASIDLSTNFRQTSTCYYAIKISQDGARFQPVSPDALCGDVITPEQVAALNRQS
ncbi:ABC transporter substrate-binding protein [Frankia sp. CNm7]|uniref:ABC transporter substrate-binding protein n=1 Tax=Frankia nepalensis TaxID=1836974 RepID=A0A937RHH9_9ACTN|nr:ABC transporter substrate-binding protein [Frankia nepalensis]MBL7495101.1 ABC transporter substrate-binding protein [Frankia nepalensis]MBL7515370.1 ABC transporter substrate-binding protein [Frankia nepalensis]MBL7522238.1 ABC transporter substrate-binding protein [Frankia nepalensis]MBL7632331.1 ABC transporter substrate-binding protein [Frankia nepalensis]